VRAASVVLDPTTLRWVLSGLYDEMVAEEFPVSYPSVEVYVALTGGHGDYLIELQMIDAGEARPPVFRQLNSVRFTNPLEVHELVYHRYWVAFPAEGEYCLRLYAHQAALAPESHGVFLTERRVRVNQTT
jgi:hypothetical protein